MSPLHTKPLKPFPLKLAVAVLSSAVLFAIPVYAQLTEKNAYSPGKSSANNKK